MGTEAFGPFDLDAMSDADVLAAVEELGLAAFAAALKLCTFDDRRLAGLIGPERWTVLDVTRRHTVRSSDAIAALAVLREYGRGDRSI
jgi:hypothetical protein